MKDTSRPFVLGAALLPAAGLAQAQSGGKSPEAIAREAGCMGCHAVAAKKVGPSFREVAKKHSKQGDKVIAAMKADKDHADAIKDLDPVSLRKLADWVSSQ
jgi:cytochrome c551/c552